MSGARERVTREPLTQEVVSPMPNQYSYSSIAERFWTKVKFTDSCWLWTAAKSPLGYGRFRLIAPGEVYAHRYAYEFCVEHIPGGLEIDHLCRVRHCVFPNHLEVVTHRENVLRGIAARA